MQEMRMSRGGNTTRPSSQPSRRREREKKIRGLTQRPGRSNKTSRQHDREIKVVRTPGSRGGLLEGESLMKERGQSKESGVVRAKERGDAHRTSDRI